jgi:hypothetical protein
MIMPDSITQELSSAYAQLAELQTKIDEDDYIISALSQNMSTHADMHRCGDEDGESCDRYDLALEIIVARRKELAKELRKVKKRIREIEEKGVRWRG